MFSADRKRLNRKQRTAFNRFQKLFRSKLRRRHLQQMLEWKTMPGKIVRLLYTKEGAIIHRLYPYGLIYPDGEYLPVSWEQQAIDQIFKARYTTK